MTPRQVFVVGRGILGLSCALALARAGHAVVVVSSPHSPRASEAAAANLALKAQVFGRDPHFALKLRARESYAQWLQGLAGDVPFASGVGLELFDAPHLRDAQEARVRQPADALAARGFGAQGVARVSADAWGALTYLGEAWVDAHALLAALETTCRALGVDFERRLVETRRDLNPASLILMIFFKLFFFF